MNDRKTHPLSVVILTKNRPVQFYRLLASISRQTVLPDELVIVENTINMSYCNTVAIRGVIGSQTTIAVHTTTAPTIAASRNIGLRNTTNKLLLSIDDDIVFDNPEIIRNLLKIYHQMPETTALFGQITPSSISRYSMLSSMQHRNGLRKKTRIQYFPSGYYLLDRMFAIKKGISFSTIFQTGEDIDFFYKLYTLGATLYFHPHISVSGDFPTTALDFFITQQNYSYNYADLYLHGLCEPNQIRIFLPARRMHLLFYPAYVIRETIFTLIDIAHRNKLTNAFWIPLGIYGLSIWTGIMRSKKARRIIFSSIQSVATRKIVR